MDNASPNSPAIPAVPTNEGTRLSSSDAGAWLELSLSTTAATSFRLPTEPSAVYLMGQAPRTPATRYDSSAGLASYEGLSSPDRPARIRHCHPHQISPPERAQHQRHPPPVSEASDVTDLRQPPSPESNAGDAPQLSDLARLRLAELKLKKVIRKHDRYLVHRDYDEPELHRAKKAEADAVLTRGGRHAGSNYRRTAWDHDWDNMVAGAARVLVGEPFERSQEETEGRRRMSRTPGVRTRGRLDEAKKNEYVFEIPE